MFVILFAYASTPSRSLRNLRIFANRSLCPRDLSFSFFLFLSYSFTLFLPLLTGSSRYKYSRWVVPHSSHLSRPIMFVQTSSLSRHRSVHRMIFIVPPLFLVFSATEAKLATKSVSLPVFSFSILLFLRCFSSSSRDFCSSFWHFRGHDAMRDRYSEDNAPRMTICAWLLYFSVFRANVEYSFHDSMYEIFEITNGSGFLLRFVLKSYVLSVSFQHHFALPPILAFGTLTDREVFPPSPLRFAFEYSFYSLHPQSAS